VADGIGDGGGGEERLRLPGGAGFAECEEDFAAEVSGVPVFEESGAEVGEFVGGGGFEEGGVYEFIEPFTGFDRCRVDALAGEFINADTENLVSGKVLGVGSAGVAFGGPDEFGASGEFCGGGEVSCGEFGGGLFKECGAGLEESAGGGLDEGMLGEEFLDASDEVSRFAEIFGGESGIDHGADDGSHPIGEFRIVFVALEDFVKQCECGVDFAGLSALGGFDHEQAFEARRGFVPVGDFGFHAEEEFVGGAEVVDFEKFVDAQQHEVLEVHDLIDLFDGNGIFGEVTRESEDEFFEAFESRGAGFAFFGILRTGSFELFVFGFLSGERIGAGEDGIDNGHAAIRFVGCPDDHPVEFLVVGIGSKECFGFGDGKFGESGEFGAGDFFVSCGEAAECAEQRSGEREEAESRSAGRAAGIAG